MKALVFGATGQLGRALVESAPPGVAVSPLARRDCNIAEPEEVRRAIKEARPDIIFNAAAYTAVDKAESEADCARLINGVAPGFVAREARACGSRLVHISTDFVFDGRSSRPYRPEDETAPLGVYAKTKRQGELAVIEAAPDALVVRTAWVYSAEGTNFVRTMLRLMSDRPEVRIVCDQIGTPTASSSLALSLWELALAGTKGIHHFTDAGVASWYDFGMAVKEEAADLGMIPSDVRVIPIGSSDYPTPAPRPSYSVLDKAQTWRLLREVPPHWRINLRKVLKELVAVG